MVPALVNRTEPGAVEALVIGASAGAIDTLSTILPALQRGCGVPVVVVVHVPPGRQSLLCQLFAPKCALPVCEPCDKQQISPDTIWFAPPDYHLLIEGDHTFCLSIDEPANFSRPSIDVLFESAAEVYGSALLAIVLTGASHDGAAGAACVRRAGGLVVVQDPASAEAATMPTAAIAAANPHFVGSPSAIAGFIKTILQGEPT